jgi:hypothetical protein
MDAAVSKRLLRAREPAAYSPLDIGVCMFAVVVTVVIAAWRMKTILQQLARRVVCSAAVAIKSKPSSAVVKKKKLRRQAVWTTRCRQLGILENSILNWRIANSTRTASFSESVFKMIH